MIITQYKCDICGKERGEGNHWIKASADKERVVFFRWQAEIGPDDKHICGDACAAILLNKFTAGRRFAEGQKVS